MRLSFWVVLVGACNSINKAPGFCNSINNFVLVATIHAGNKASPLLSLAINKLYFIFTDPTSAASMPTHASCPSARCPKILFGKGCNLLF
jgi:hypothetical protein